MGRKNHRMLPSIPPSGAGGYGEGKSPHAPGAFSAPRASHSWGEAPAPGPRPPQRGRAGDHARLPSTGPCGTVRRPRGVPQEGDALRAATGGGGAGASGAAGRDEDAVRATPRSPGLAPRAADSGAARPFGAQGHAMPPGAPRI